MNSLDWSNCQRHTGGVYRLLGHFGDVIYLEILKIKSIDDVTKLL